jgi:DNA-binding NarL/FixJ family response regulator
MMNILLVEDSPSDREILKQILDSQFKGKATFYEAVTLAAAVETLEHRRIDCTILDLQLPDSIGRETFQKLNGRFPDVPLIVMTHSKDRALALDMIQQGAADFLIKSYSGLDEEDLFRRITFAVEKHRLSVRVQHPGAASSYHRLERAKSNLLEAQDKEESPSTIRNITIEVTSAVAELSSKMFTELQQINIKLAQQGTQQETLVQTVTSLDKELLRGHSNRPSMRSQVDLLDLRLTNVEGAVRANGEEHIQIVQTKMSARTKVIIAVLTLLGVLGTAAATYFTATHKPSAQEGQP